MSHLSGPTYAAIVLGALARHPGRVAFRSGDQDVSYRAAQGWIARMQSVMAARGVGRGGVVAVLSANRWETWCAGIAAQSLGAAVTPLHPIGSLESHLFQLEDAGVILGFMEKVEHIPGRTAAITSRGNNGIPRILRGHIRETIERAASFAEAMLFVAYYVAEFKNMPDFDNHFELVVAVISQSSGPILHHGSTPLIGGQEPFVLRSTKIGVTLRATTRSATALISVVPSSASGVIDWSASAWKL